MRTVLLALLFAPTAAAKATESRELTIYVVRHGWHTGIALPHAELPAGAWPESVHFPQARYIEFGWGDRDFYMTPGFNVWYALKALFWPTASVLHVVGLTRNPTDEFFDVAEVSITRAGLENLLDYVNSSFERTGREAAVPLGPGQYGVSAFYASHERFHLFKTCNVWTARALRAAGLPISSSVSAERIMDQARRLSPATSIAAADSAREAQ